MRIPVLDGVRGLAILLVIANHTLFVPWSSASPLDRILPPLLAGTWGWVGVDLFFVLSGFLITGILLDTKGDPRFFRNFYARRALRIFPLYFAFLALCFWVLPRTRLPWAGELLDVHPVWFWTYTINLRPDLYRSVSSALVHVWSLCVEEYFYLLWPLLVWRLDARALGKACLAFLLGGPLLRFALRAAGADFDAVFILPLARCDAMAWGALAAWLARRPGGLAAWRGRAWAALLGMGLPAAAWLAWHGHFRHAPPAVFALGLSCLAGAFTGLLVLVLTAPEGAGWARVFRSRGLGALGKYSYAIYLLHPLVGGCLMFLEGGAVPCLKGSYMPGMILYGAGVLAVSSGLAWLSWHAFEARCLRLKRHFEPPW